jgi:phosphoenolpyruvate synthase/pyruvate phosphate dikinase
MAELPSNMFLADQYADIFDGFSIGSNDLTQLILAWTADFAAFLVEQGIDSISLTPDSLLKTSERVLQAEQWPTPSRPTRRIGDVRLPKPLEAVSAYADTEPMLPDA